MDNVLNYNQAQQGQFMGGGGGGFDLKALLAGANMQHGNPHDLEKPMTALLGAVESVQKPDATIDEAALAAAHAQAYDYPHPQPAKAHQLSTEEMGGAAAIQAFRDFAGAGVRQAQEGPGHQSLISKLIGMSMSEALDIYQRAGGAADNGTGLDVMCAAGKAIIKLLIQNQVQGALGGDYGSGGHGANIGQLMNIAAKFARK